MRKQKHAEANDYGQVDQILQEVLSAEIDEMDLWDELKKIFSQKWTPEDNFEIHLSFYLKTLEALESPKNGNFCVNFRIPDHMMQILSENIQLKYNFPEEYMSKNGWNGNWDMDTFMDFYESYMKIAYHIDFLKCSWGLSSGESNMFNFFARLYKSLKIEEKKNIILTFDELDSSFHPQWQQKIVHSLTEFLRKRYPNKEFQLILTTHSPVLLSDIPKQNVIFMRKASAAAVDHTQTFAANIASLYYDSFFMDNGSIGEVAKRSIIHFMDAVTESEEAEKNKITANHGRAQELLYRFMGKQYPNAVNHIERSEKECQNLLQLLIDSIGEDIWRYKANERYHHFLNAGKDKREKLWNDLTELAQEQGSESVEILLKEWLERKDQ